MAVASGIPFLHKHMVFVLVSDTVRPNAQRTRPQRRPSSSWGAPVNARRLLRLRRRETCPTATSLGLALRRLLLFAPMPPFSAVHQASMTSLTTLKRVLANVYSRRKNMLKVDTTRVPHLTICSVCSFGAAPFVLFCFVFPTVPAAWCGKGVRFSLVSQPQSAGLTSV